MNSKKITIIVAACALLGLIATITGMSIKISKLNNELSLAVNNNKAYQSQLDSATNKCVVFKMDIETLEATNKDLMNRVAEIEKENKIKDKQISYLNHLKTTFTKADTIHLVDTVFKEPSFKLDTIIGDEWMSTKLHLQYPSNINMETNVKSDKVVMLYAQKETIKPRKKFFLARWFQKKHTVARAIIDEKNPHIISEQNEFYQVVK